ncbi:MAG TPA: hypothetical protein VGO47_12025 [Chlamydiales bacterium]|nr:hypothetical protein [Chlamydiales bacterium]
MCQNGGFTDKKADFGCIVCPYTAQESFGPAVQILMDNWWSIFSENALEILSRKDSTFTPTPAYTYDRILGYLKESLTSLYGMEVQPSSRVGLGKRVRAENYPEREIKQSRKN